MTRILHIISGLGPGGAQSCLLNLVQTKKDNVTHAIISLDNNDVYTDRVHASVFSLENRPINFGIMGLNNFLYLIRFIRKFSPDIVQTWLYRADLLGTLALFFSRYDAQLVWNVRCSDMDGRYDSGINSFLIKILSYLSILPKVVVYNSSAGLKSHLYRGYIKKNAQLIPNGIDTEKFFYDNTARTSIREELGIPDNAFLVGCIGRYDKVKAHCDFLQAINNNSGIWGLIVGSGTTKALDIKNTISILGIDSRVKILEQRDDIPAIMSSLDVFVSTSRSEGFPTVIAEAMACEIPVVATKAGDTERIVGNTDFLCSPRDCEGISNNIATIRSMSSEDRQSIGRNYRERIISNFSIEKMLLKYDLLFSYLSRPKQNFESSKDSP